MISLGAVLLVLKYIIAICILICILLAPVYLAAVNEKNKVDLVRTRAGSWLFGWTFVGWLVALFISVKK